MLHALPQSEKGGMVMGQMMFFSLNSPTRGRLLEAVLIE
jgi:hypothetical protein